MHLFIHIKLRGGGGFTGRCRGGSWGAKEPYFLPDAIADSVGLAPINSEPIKMGVVQYMRFPND